jgi:hypothetical protein
LKGRKRRERKEIRERVNKPNEAQILGPTRLAEKKREERRKKKRKEVPNQLLA